MAVATARRKETAARLREPSRRAPRRRHQRDDAQPQECKTTDHPETPIREQTNDGAWLAPLAGTRLAGLHDASTPRCANARPHFGTGDVQPYASGTASQMRVGDRQILLEPRRAGRSPLAQRRPAGGVAALFVVGVELCWIPLTTRDAVVHATARPAHAASQELRQVPAHRWLARAHQAGRGCR